MYINIINDIENSFYFSLFSLLHYFAPYYIMLHIEQYFVLYLDLLYYAIK